ncbi:Nucleoside-diphosphate-sugar epimerase [Klebsiella michiganensis]|uniref:Nucleoside-diphosphate-sugar epimerase n=1 Tax=Klebsiella michiganensis TaxID=1134687 RepID=A0A7H4MVL3_9ENTR|nr:Nucleoside-diphosphate-sugar epimerase [Klebsiella michiganensis]
MKKVAIVGLGWLGMPLALSLMSRGWQVTGSKTTQDGVEAARMCGIDGYPLRLEPQLVCDTEDLDALMNVDALVITLPRGEPDRERTFIFRRYRRSSIPRWRIMCRASYSPAQRRFTATPAAR